MSPERRFLGEFEQMVAAAVLHLGDDAYGVTIIDVIRARTGRSVRSGALSVTLDRMQEKGLVRSLPRAADDGRGGRPRRYVRLTPEGLAAAAHARTAMLELWRGLDEAFDG